MGMLIDGVWCAEADRYMQDGAFVRESSKLSDPAPSEIARHLSGDGRTVLVASLSCPWSHRTTLVRALKNLPSLPVVTAGGPRTEGYALPENDRGLSARHVHELYSATNLAYSGRATVPLLWDIEARTVLSNSSATIARALDALTGRWRLAPAPQAAQIDAINARIFDGLANAVYRAGFAMSQHAYASAVAEVFAALDWLERRLTNQRCLLGNQVTEADLFLFASLVRFDAVYVPLFRCTRRRLIDYPALWAYARDVYSWPRISETVDFEANLTGYFQNDTDNNPHGIVPELPDADWREPHGRDRLGVLSVWQDGALVDFENVAEVRHAD